MNVRKLSFEPIFTCRYYSVCEMRYPAVEVPMYEVTFYDGIISSPTVEYHVWQDHKRPIPPGAKSMEDWDNPKIHWLLFNDVHKAVEYGLSAEWKDLGEYTTTTGAFHA